MENLIERMVILNDDELITAKDLPLRFQELSMVPGGDDSRGPRGPGGSSREVLLTDRGINLNALVEEVEKNLISQALQKSQGVKSKAAELLGLKRTTLLEKIKKLELEL